MNKQEINEACAVKLGWKKNQTFWQGPFEKMKGGALFSESSMDVPDYSGSIAAAWELVDEMSKRGIGTYLFGGLRKYWHCDLHTHPAGHDNPNISESADTPAMAIALCFLKLP